MTANKTESKKPYSVFLTIYCFSNRLLYEKKEKIIKILGQSPWEFKKNK